MSGRTLNGNSFSNSVYVNTLSGGSALAITTADNSTSSTIDLKISKQDTQSTFEDTDMIVIEDASGNIKKVLGSVVKDSADGFFTKVSSNIYPDATSENLLLGATSNTDTRKFLVNGTSEFQGVIYSKGATGVAGYINIYDTDKLHHTSLYPTENINANVYLPNISTTLVGTNTTDTLTFKTLTSPTITSPTITGTGAIAGVFTGNLTGNADTSTKIASITNSNIVQLTDSQTLTNKTFGNNTIFSITPTFNATLRLNGGSGISAQLDMYAVNGLNFIALKSPNTLSGDFVLTLPAIDDTLITKSSNDILTNKSFNDLTVFEEGLAVKQSSGSTSGNIRFFDKDNSNYIDLHIENHTVSSNYNMYLPNDIDESVLVGTRNTQTIINKTLSTGTVYNGNTIAVGYGGTGLASYVVGDLLYSSATATLSRLAIGSNNKFLMSNGTNPVWNTLTLTDPLNINGTTINLGNLSGWGSNNQIIASNGSDTLEYRTLTAGNNITITNTSSAITITGADDYWENANTLGVLDIQPVSSVNDIDLDGINLLVIPKTVNVIPSGSLASGKVIQYDSGLGGGNGSMVFGDNGSSATVNWDTGIYAKQFINMKCGTDTLLQLNNTPASVASATFTLNDINIDLGTNNGYSNITYVNCEPLMLFNKASSGTVHSHLVMKRDSSQSDYIILKQNDSDELLFHHENSGDDFIVGKAFEYGHKGAKWKYTDPYTYLYNPEDSNGTSSASGSIMSFHKNGSVVFFNSTSTYSSGNTNYFSFAKSDDQQARITMDGNAQIAVAWLDSNDPSDRRIKYDIKDYENATAVIDKIKIKSFMKYQLKNFNNDNEGKMLPFTDRLGEAKYSIGVIAQEIADIPELAFMVEGNFEDTINPAYIHNYIPIISLLVKSNQEQQETINELKATIDKLNSATSFKDFKSK